jgi:Concanavalin A-like lectin/glucanases superfamily
MCFALAACGGGRSSLPPASSAHAQPGGTNRAVRAAQQYVAAVMADAPIVYYRMNETSGTTAVDSSGNNRNGTYGSSVVLGGGALVNGDAAPTFPGGTASSAKVMTSSNASALAPTGAMSVEFWIKVPATVSGTHLLWTQPFASGSAGYPAYIALNGGSSPYFTMQVNANGTVLAAYPAPVLNANNHVVLTWSGSSLTAYVNGVASTGDSGSGPLSNYASPYTGFTVGGPNDPHTGFAGQMGEFALYGTALSAARVTAHYNAALAAAPTPPPSSGYSSTVLADAPVVYYRMNETSGTTATDSSGHGYNATYGSSVALGTGAVMTGESAPSFPGGTASPATVLRSSTNSALAPTTGAMSVEFWVHVPATLSGTQFLWSQPFASGSAPLPSYISLDGGANPYFTMQVNANGTTISAYPAPVLNANNHVVLTWTGTTLTAYVNGVASAGGTGSGPLKNYTSPYTGFTLGGPTDAHTGYAGAIGEFAFYSTALSAARVTAHYNAGIAAAPSRTPVWSIGDPWQLPSTNDGQETDKPVFSGSAATCVPEQTSAQCTGGSGTVSFHVQRPSVNTVPAPEYRNMMVLEQWNADHSYAPNLELTPDGSYDVQFQTVDHMPNDAQYVQSLLWQDHSGNGDVITGFGMDNPDGNGNQFFFNYGAHEGGISDPFPWHGTATLNATDTWEVQFRNSQDATGWVDFYRNGTLQFHYSGPVVTSTTFDLMSFGIYYYDWEISRSTLTSTDITFNYFKLSSIPGPIPPASP